MGFFAKNDAAQFETLCAPYAPMVYRHCLHMLKNPAEAEDAAQESMLRAFRSFARYSGKGTAAWLFAIAHNVCLDILKSARYRRESAVLDSDDAPEAIDPALRPDEIYEQNSEKKRLWAAVSQLPEEQQLLISLFYEEGLSYEEIAKATGVKSGTVKSRLSRAKDALQKIWQNEP